MSKSKNDEIITEAKPHTIKKFELIARYVTAWVHKILNCVGNENHSSAKGVVFIDCMSNSGVYKDIAGNRVEGTALRVAKILDDALSMYPNRCAILFFNDLREDRINHLKSEIDLLELKHVDVRYSNQDCNEFLCTLNKTFNWDGLHSLLLYDPYNASIDWNAITPYLRRWGEVMINHMSSDTVRGISQAKKGGSIDRYEMTYQTSVETLVNAKKEDLDRIVMSIIKDNVNKKQYYVSHFAFYNRSNGKLYSLIHCSAHIEGIKLYKNVAWKTFGGKSSLKDTHGSQNQLELDFEGSGHPETETDDQCYYVHDIAQYIYKLYQHQCTVSWDEVCKMLDEHPIFPSDGFKKQIKNELERLGVKCKNKMLLFS